MYAVIARHPLRFDAMGGEKILDKFDQGNVAVRAGGVERHEPREQLLGSEVLRRQNDLLTLTLNMDKSCPGARMQIAPRQPFQRYSLVLRRAARQISASIRYQRRNLAGNRV